MNLFQIHLVLDVMQLEKKQDILKKINWALIYENEVIINGLLLTLQYL